MKSRFKPEANFTVGGVSISRSAFNGGRTELTVSTTNFYVSVQAKKKVVEEKWEEEISTVVRPTELIFFKPLICECLSKVATHQSFDEIKNSSTVKEYITVIGYVSGRFNIKPVSPHLHFKYLRLVYD